MTSLHRVFDMFPIPAIRRWHPTGAWLGALMIAALAQPLLAQGKARSPQDTIKLRTVVNRLHASMDEVALQNAATANQTGVAVEVGGGKAVLSYANEDKGWTIKLSTPVDSSATSADFASLDGLADNLTASYTYSREFMLNEKSDWNVPKIPKRTALRGDWQKREDLCKDILGEERTRTFKWGAELTLGRRKAEFFDDAGVAQDDEKFSSSLSVYSSSQGPKSRFTVKAAVQSAYKDGATVSKCQPVTGATGLESCKDLPFGEPTRQESTMLTAEWRQHAFCDPAKSSCRIGLAPVIAHDLDASITGIDLPVYLLSTGDQLTGGVRFGWRSDTEDLQVSVFISKPFSLDDDD